MKAGAIVVSVLLLLLFLYVNETFPPISTSSGAAPPAVTESTAPAPADSSDPLLPSADPAPSAPLSSAAPPPASSGPAPPGSILWAADPARGSRSFDTTETLPGTVTVAADPQGRYGPSFRYETWENPDGHKARCESKGMRQPDGSVLALDDSKLGRVFYLGWRSLWTPLPTQSGAWISLFQLHVSGVQAGGLNVGPFVLRTLGDGKLYFQLFAPDGADRHIWSTALSVNAWNSFVIGFKLSRGGDGWVEFWYNGVAQKFTNGSTRMPGPTLWGTHDNVKWGIYRSGANHTGHAVAYLNHARLGTSYGAVAP
jgi:hypothetical protein